jgi:hypothetical protein
MLLLVCAFDRFGMALGCHVFVLFFLFLIVWLCAFLMSRLVLGIELFQKLDVIHIDLILIYYALSKK